MDDTVDNLPIAQFFSQYEDSGFHYSPSNSASDEFNRLCRHLGFPASIERRKKLKAYRDARSAYDDALTMQFNQVYGTNLEDYDAWYTLCSKIGIYPIPSTVSECRKVMKATHVNLVDLTQCFDDSHVEVFATQDELRSYSIQHKRFFPRNNIHSGDILKYLLRKFF